MAILVDENARLSKALELHPDVLDYIVSLNPHDFKRLHNPLMRKLMPPRIRLKRIAAMTGTPIAELMAVEVKEHTTTCFITRSVRDVQVGDELLMRKGY